MKIYVDGELPECCNDCEFGDFYDCQYCSLRPDLAREDIWVEKEKHCPLLSIESLKQQVREEVVEEIREKFNDTIKHHFCPNPSSVDFIALCISEVEEFLDQVKGESNETNKN